MAFNLGKSSESHLVGVYEPLVRVVRLAIQLSTQDFSVIDGLRDVSRQAEYLKSGASKTTNSRHLTGHAVDLLPYYGLGINPWPEHSAAHLREDRLLGFRKIACAMFEAADSLEVPLQWGNDWNSNGVIVRDDPAEKFSDLPHFQIPFHFNLERSIQARFRRMQERQENKRLVI